MMCFYERNEVLKPFCNYFELQKITMLDRPAYVVQLSSLIL